MNGISAGFVLPFYTAGEFGREELGYRLAGLDGEMEGGVAVCIARDTGVFVAGRDEKFLREEHKISNAF